MAILRHLLEEEMFAAQEELAKDIHQIIAEVDSTIIVKMNAAEAEARLASQEDIVMDTHAALDIVRIANQNAAEAAMDIVIIIIACLEICGPVIMLNVQDVIGAAEAATIIMMTAQKLLALM
jgi:hypothetical protein